MSGTEMLMERVRFMRQCAGLPTGPDDAQDATRSLQPVRPHVVLLKRKYFAGRSINRLDEVSGRRAGARRGKRGCLGLNICAQRS